MIETVRSPHDLFLQNGKQDTIAGWNACVLSRLRQTEEVAAPNLTSSRYGGYDYDATKTMALGLAYLLEP